MWPEGEGDRRLPHMMPAYDPNVCDDVCRLFLSCREEAAGEKAELKGLIAGCGGQAFEHLPAACPPDPAPWCGSPAITGLARAGRWRRRPRPLLMVAGLPAPFVCGRPARLRFGRTRLSGKDPADPLGRDTRDPDPPVLGVLRAPKQ